MKLRNILAWSPFLCLTATLLHAQATNEIEQLKKQLHDMQENFERVQRQQREQIDSLTKKLDDLRKQQAADAEKKKLLSSCSFSSVRVAALGGFFLNAHRMRHQFRVAARPC